MGTICQAVTVTVAQGALDSSERGRVIPGPSLTKLQISKDVRVYHKGLKFSKQMQTLPKSNAKALIERLLYAPPGLFLCYLTFITLRGGTSIFKPR